MESREPKSFSLSQDLIQTPRQRVGRQTGIYIMDTSKYHMQFLGKLFCRAKRMEVLSVSLHFPMLSTLGRYH